MNLDKMMNNIEAENAAPQRGLPKFINYSTSTSRAATWPPLREPHLATHLAPHATVGSWPQLMAPPTATDSMPATRKLAVQIPTLDNQSDSTPTIIWASLARP